MRDISNQIGLNGYICVPKDDLQQVIQHLPEHIRLTKSEAGCLKFEVIQSADNPLIFDVSEIYTDKAAFESHQKRLTKTIWADVTRNVTRHYQTFEIPPEPNN